MGKFWIVCAVFACLTGSVSATVVPQEAGLRELSLNSAETSSASYLFRIAHFSPDEAVAGSGALIVAVSADRKKAMVSLNGVRTELSALGNLNVATCIAGSNEQQVFARDQMRLMLKLKSNPQDGICAYQGLALINIDKHMKRYMVKAVRTN